LQKENNQNLSVSFVKQTFSSCSYPRAQATRINSICKNEQLASWILNQRKKTRKTQQLHESNIILESGMYLQNFTFARLHCCTQARIAIDQGPIRIQFPHLLKTQKSISNRIHKKYICKKCISKSYFT